MAGEQATTGESGQQASAFSMKSGLVAIVERLLQRPLSGTEVQHWNSIQDQYGIADDDPLVIVLTLLALHQHLFNDLPKKVIEATEKAIAIHRTTLDDQATIVAKGMLVKLAPMFVEAAKEARGQGSGPGPGLKLQTWMVVAFGLACGVVGGILVHLIGR